MQKYVIGSLVVLAAACAVRPDYQKPQLSARNAWSALDGARVDASADDLAHWWQSFGDPLLDRLIERATDSNYDVRIAAARVRDARRAESESGTLPADGSSHELHRTGFDAVWELDVYGGQRRAVEAEGAELDMVIEERRDVLVTLLGEVARTYIDLRGQQRLVALQTKHIAAARSTLALTRTRSNAGLATTLDVAQAEAQLATTEVLLPQAQRAARAAVHRLGLLLGEEPEALAAELATESAIPSPPARIAAGLPSDLLARRPDVRRAERKLASATARVGVATADLYPKFALLGAESVDLSDLSASSSRLWSAGFDSQWSLFDGGRRRANIEVAGAQAEQALIGYERTFLLALEEVEHALHAYAREWERRKSLAEAVVASGASVELAGDLYSRGLTDFLEVLAAERDLYEAQCALAASEAALSIRAVALYKGLAGGWDFET
ncbi:MAG: efflux transporter outer membrane subunit [Planctomycetota bacterium]